MTYLPDVNIWIALAAERHSHHGAAERWFKNLSDQKLVFCRTTQLGFLRLLTNRHVMEEEVMNPDQAWQAYRALRYVRVGESGTLPRPVFSLKRGMLSQR